jgi:hypothetical protein
MTGLPELIRETNFTLFPSWFTSVTSGTVYFSTVRLYDGFGALKTGWAEKMKMKVKKAVIMEYFLLVMPTPAMKCLYTMSTKQWLQSQDFVHEE